ALPFPIAIARCIGRHAIRRADRAKNKSKNENLKLLINEIADLSPSAAQRPIVKHVGSKTVFFLNKFIILFCFFFKSNQLKTGHHTFALTLLTAIASDDRTPAPAIGAKLCSEDFKLKSSIPRSQKLKRTKR